MEPFIRISTLDSAPRLARGASRLTAPAAAMLAKKFLRLTVIDFCLVDLQRKALSSFRLSKLFLRLCAFAGEVFSSQKLIDRCCLVEDEQQPQPHFIVHYFDLAQPSGKYFVVAAFHFVR